MNKQKQSSKHQSQQTNEQWNKTNYKKANRVMEEQNEQVN